MRAEPTVDDEIQKRNLSSEELSHAVRAYLSERMGNPSTADLEASLGRMVEDLPKRIETIAQDADRLRRAATAILAAAWDDPGERPRVEAAFEVRTDRMAVADPYSIAVIVMYGLYLLAGLPEREANRRVDPATGEVSSSVREKGLVAILRDWIGPETAELSAPRSRLPGEGHFTIASFAVQDYPGPTEGGVEPAAHAWLAQTIRRALDALGAGDETLLPRNRGDGWQLVIDEAAIGLSVLVRDLPPLIAGPLTDYQPGEAEPLKVRLAIHTDHLFATANGWEGHGLDEAARIADAKEVRRQLTGHPGRLATVLSDPVYRAVAFRRSPARGYTPVTVKVNGRRTPIWLALR